MRALAIFVVLLLVPLATAISDLTIYSENTMIVKMKLRF